MLWIWIQEKIFLIIVGIAIFLPKEIYYSLVGLAVMFSLTEIFMPWLLTVQLVNIFIATLIGSVIIYLRDNIFNIFTIGVERVSNIFVQNVNNTSKFAKNGKKYFAIILVGGFLFCLCAMDGSPIKNYVMEKHKKAEDAKHKAEREAEEKEKAKAKEIEDKRAVVENIKKEIETKRSEEIKILQEKYEPIFKSTDDYDAFVNTRANICPIKLASEENKKDIIKLMANWDKCDLDFRKKYSYLGEKLGIYFESKIQVEKEKEQKEDFQKLPEYEREHIKNQQAKDSYIYPQ